MLYALAACLNSALTACIPQKWTSMYNAELDKDRSGKLGFQEFYRQVKQFQPPKVVHAYIIV